LLEDLDDLMETEEIDSLMVMGNAFDNPDIYWLTGFRSPDNIICLHNHGEETIVATAFKTLERLEKESLIEKTFDLTELYQSFMERGERAADNPEKVMDEILKENFNGEVMGVPKRFPSDMLIAIQKLGYEVKPVPDLLLQARATKSEEEIKMIEKAGEATISALSKVIEMIKNTGVGANDILITDGEPLTVRDVKQALNHNLLDLSAEAAEDSIVAVGQMGFDWHYLGNPDDKLKANVPIIMDVFPRLKIERYVADVTRTVVKGTPSDKVREMFYAVMEAGDAVLDEMTAGADIDDVNMACYNTLKEHGFDSSRLNPGAKEGMTHSLGHGIGLEVHEYPSMYVRDGKFKEGHVVAIEPGIYLMNEGGVRIENDFVVTKDKPRRTTMGLEEILYL